MKAVRFSTSGAYSAMRTSAKKNFTPMSPRETPAKPCSLSRTWREAAAKAQWEPEPGDGMFSNPVDSKTRNIHHRGRRAHREKGVFSLLTLLYPFPQSAQLSTEKLAEASCQAPSPGIQCAQTEPGSVKNLPAQSKEGARIARFQRPQIFCTAAGQPVFPHFAFSLV